MRALADDGTLTATEGDHALLSAAVAAVEVALTEHGGHDPVARLTVFAQITVPWHCGS